MEDENKPRMITVFFDEVWFTEYDGKLISELITDLLELEANAQEKNCTNIKIFSDDCDGYIALHGVRLETDIEVKHRKDREKVASFRMQEAEKVEYETYLRLHEKYGYYGKDNPDENCN